jgi:hypothetical protein
MLSTPMVSVHLFAPEVGRDLCSPPLRFNFEWLSRDEHTDIVSADWKESKRANNPLRRSTEIHPPPQTRKNPLRGADTPPKMHDAISTASPASRAGRNSANVNTSTGSNGSLSRLSNHEHWSPSPGCPPNPRQPLNGSPKVETPAFKRDGRLFASLREGDVATLKIKSAFARDADSPRTPPRGAASEKPRQRLNPRSNVDIDEGHPMDDIMETRSIDGLGMKASKRSMPRFTSETASVCGSGESEAG